MPRDDASEAAPPRGSAGASAQAADPAAGTRAEGPVATDATLPATAYRATATIATEAAVPATDAGNGRDPPALEPTHRATSHWLRRDAAGLTAALVSRFGLTRLDDIEDAIAFALTRALETWPWRGLPDDVPAWLATTARHHLADRYRRVLARETGGEEAEAALESLHAAQAPAAALAPELDDADVKLLFACAHPALTAETRAAFTLKVACRFSVPEISSALLVEEPAIAQRIVRAKRTLRALEAPLEVPAGAQLQERQAAVLEVLLLLYNEGYEASAGEALLRVDLCVEALRLVELLLAHPLTCTPSALALGSLLHLLHARVHARVGLDGLLVPLGAQDRSTWSAAHLRRGLMLLAQSAQGPEASRYHLLAGIAAAHATAPSTARTDWRHIVGLYEQLVALEDSPVHRLNRAVAVSQSGRNAEGLGELEALRHVSALRSYPWYFAALAELLRREGRLGEVDGALAEGEACARTPPQRAFFAAKRSALRSR